MQREASPYFSSRIDILQFIKKNVYPQAFSKIYTFSIFGAVFALDHHRLCAHVQSSTMCYHRLQQRAVQGHPFCLLPINITLGKNPHACFLKSTLTKREQLRRKHHTLKSWFFFFKKKNISICHVERMGTVFLFWTMEFRCLPRELHPFLIYLESCSASQSTVLRGGLALYDFSVPNNDMNIWVRDGERKSEKEQNENAWAGPGLKFDPKPDSEYRCVL